MKLLNPQILNFLSLLLTMIGCVTLLFNWNQLGLVKKYTLVFLTLCCMFVAFRINYKKQMRSSKVLTKTRLPQRKQQFFSDPVLKRAGAFLAQRSQRNQRKSLQEQHFMNRVSRNQQNQYLSTSRLDKNYYSLSQYKPYSGMKQSSYGNLLNQTQSNLRIDKQLSVSFFQQDINSITKTFQTIISPIQHMQKFLNLINFIKKTPLERYKLSIQRQYESIMIDKDQRIFLTSTYDVFLLDQVLCSQLLCEYLENRIEGTVTFFRTNIKMTSELAMKCFGLRIIFSEDQSYSSKNDSQSATIWQLKENLKRIKTGSGFIDKFNTLMPLRQFMSQHMDRLINLTQNCFRIIQYIKYKQDLSFQIYINILKQDFPQQKIQICRTLSIYSQQMKRIKHGFFVNNQESLFYTTYNRIEGFMTKNSFIAILAFFIEIYKAGRCRNVKIVSGMNKFFREKKA